MESVFHSFLGSNFKFWITTVLRSQDIEEKRKFLAEGKEVEQQKLWFHI